jgi:spore coat protein CotH
MTLHFDKFEPGQNFHGLTKIHLNNSVQDTTALSEQFGREIFKQLGIIAPRATPALVHLNERDFGLCVLVEGANKQFIQRNFKSAKGNLYDGGAGGDITKSRRSLGHEGTRRRHARA